MNVKNIFTFLLFISIASLNNNSAQILFEKYYDLNGESDAPNDIIQTKDGGFILTGYADVNNHSDGFVLRINQDGDSLWSKIFNRGTPREGLCVREDGDGNFIITAYNDRLQLYKWDMNGDKIWEKKYNSYAFAFSLVVTEDGYIAGTSGNWTDSTGIIKTDYDGQIQWATSFSSGEFRCGEKTTDGGFVFGGDDIAVKLDKNGDIEWMQTDLKGHPAYGGSVVSIKETLDSGFILLNSYQTNRMNLMKLNKFGESIWTRTFYSIWAPISLFLTQDGGYIFTGITRGSDSSKLLSIIKTNEYGDSIWNHNISSKRESSYPYYDKIIVCQDGGYLLAGSTDPETREGDIYVIKIMDPNLATIEKEDADYVRDNYSLSQNYPNPFNPKTIIKYTLPAIETGYIPSLQIKIYDILGKEISTILDRKQKPGNYEIEFDGSDLSGGIYLYRLKTDKFTEVKKMVLIK